jgi:hypothetical protein
MLCNLSSGIVSALYGGTGVTAWVAASPGAVHHADNRRQHLLAFSVLNGRDGPG